MRLLTKRLLAIVMAAMLLPTWQTTYAEDSVATEEITVEETVAEETTAEETEEISFAEDEATRHAIDKAEAGHVFTGAPITKVPENLKEPDPRGGTVLRFPNMYFDRPGTEWLLPNDTGEMRFVDQGGGVGYHEYIVHDTTKSQGIYNTLLKWCTPIKPNRKYILSVLVWLDYTRAADREATEVTCGVRMSTDLDEIALSSRHGMPDYTGGWKRVEFEFSNGQSQAASNAAFFMNIFKMPEDCSSGHVAIADACLIELPPTEVPEPYAEGEGVVFRGSAGEIDMKVLGATQTDKEIKVETTGTVYTFDLENDIITTSQKIGKKRDVSTWKVDTDLSTLKIGRQTEKECVISNPEITFGVQMDGMMFLTPHKGEVALTCTSLISGLWNRYHFGHLNVVDGYGGFCVTPDIPMGTGLLSQCEVLTENLDFTTYQFENQLFMGSKERTGENGYDMNKLVSNCKPGFQFKWTVRPAERLAIGTFPPKEFDYEEYFANRYRILTYDTWNPIIDIWNEEGYRFDNLLIWKYADFSYANEYKTRYSYHMYEDRFIATLDAIRKAGARPSMYMSSYFTPHKDTPDAYINEVKRIRDTYGIEGIYSDGTPSEWRWVTAYEMVRMLREAFPDGFINLHNTGIHENGGPPLSSPSYFIPALDAYATIVYKGEGVGVLGMNPPLVNLTLSQRNVSNSNGRLLGDQWYYYNEAGEKLKVSRDDQNILGLEWGAHGGFISADPWLQQYLPALDQMEELWKEKGDEPDFFDRYWAPKAREIAKPVAAKYGHYIELDEHFDAELNPKYYGFHDTTHAVVDSGNGNTALQMKGSADKVGSMIKRFAPIGGPVDISYRFKVEERGNFEHAISDIVDGLPISLRFTRDGRICLGNRNSTAVGIARYKKGEWIDVKLEINTDTHSYNVFINGKQVAHNIKIADNVYNISEMEFTDGGAGAVCYIDDLKVVNRYE